MQSRQQILKHGFNYSKLVQTEELTLTFQTRVYSNGASIQLKHPRDALPFMQNLPIKYILRPKFICMLENYHDTNLYMSSI